MPTHKLSPARTTQRLFALLCLACLPAVLPAAGLFQQPGTMIAESPPVPGGTGRIVSPPIEPLPDPGSQHGIEPVAAPPTPVTDTPVTETDAPAQPVDDSRADESDASRLPAVETAVPALIRDEPAPEVTREELSADPLAIPEQDMTTDETAAMDSPVTAELAAAERALAAGEVEQALALLHTAALRGDPAAQTRLGDLYREGDAVPPNPERAVLWYRRAARTGGAEAQFQLGRMYMHGHGVLLDESTAKDWFNLAAKHGHVDARGELLALEQRIEHRRGRAAQPPESVAVREEVLTALETESEAAAMAMPELVTLPEPGQSTANGDGNRSDAQSLYQQGQRLALGDEVARDPQAAVGYYRQAAELGHAPAQYRLGAAYHFGEGVDRDFERAAEWYQRAAEQGFTMAQRNLSGLYLRGEGVDQDRIQALAWLNLVATRGSDLDREQQQRLAAELTEDEQQQARELAGKLVIGE